MNAVLVRLDWQRARGRCEQKTSRGHALGRVDTHWVDFGVSAQDLSLDGRLGGDYSVRLVKTRTPMGSVSNRMVSSTEKTVPKLRCTVRRLMLLVLGVALLLYLSGIGRGLTPANVARVQPGMTRGQVDAALGPPNFPSRFRRGDAFWDEYRFLGAQYVSVHVFYDSAGRVERVKTGGFWHLWWKFW